MLDLNDEQRMIVSSLRNIVQEEFEKTASDWNGEMPWENLQILADHGFYGINFDEEYGGAGMTEFEAILATEIIGRECPLTAWHYGDQHLISPRAIQEFGSEAVKERYLPSIMEAEDRIAVGMSEPEAGSDLKAMTTAVEERDGELVLNGEKIWMSSAPECVATIIWAMFPEGMGTLILNLDADGVEFVSDFTNMAGEVQSQIRMNDVIIPEENVLTRGEGFKLQMKALNWERLAGTTIANATALCALDKALDYSQDRKQFGQPIGDFQGIEFKLADMVTELQASRQLLFQTGKNAVDQGRVPDPMETLMASLYAAQTAGTVVDEALQIHGANGYMQGHDLEYLYRFARGFRIGGGTDEILKNEIAKFLKEEGAPRL
ncbi:acyl-CoA dehydrogenase [Natronomonas sp. CBA1123]|uniref:acyl-CoA dehydrogenase family protein n=1 Tax=Natronomonas sp. CBA1123 TaxID=2668070 RepID=UPI0012EAE69D|nr:acyl-CoA dehydrogenase family protein [Natronomonas sp. CBA1123]MUV85562.1 acyl-CoA dehydrogenase [Natronomonas sp. CBA1123]